MPKFFYHGTTKENYESIQRDGYIQPGSGNTYNNVVFLAGNDIDARIITFLKHAKHQGEEIVVYKIPKYVLKKQFLSSGDKHTAFTNNKTWKYSKPIPIDKTWVASIPTNINLPEGVTIMRDGSATGFSVTPEAARQLGIE
jgi:hypothetical protein